MKAMSNVKQFVPKTKDQDIIVDDAKAILVDTDDHAEDSITLSDSAVTRIKELLAEDEEAEALKLRIFISGGGCSGFQYGFTFDEKANDDDTVVEKDGVELLVDYMSLQYLEGAEVDYKSDATGEQFVIRNPNAKTTCGCGSSFGI